MAELVFNPLSVRPDLSLPDAQPLLVEAAAAMAELVSREMAGRVLRMTQPWTMIPISDGSLWDVMVAMLRGRTNLEEVSFLMGMAQRAPLLEGLQHEIAGRFLTFCPRPPGADRDSLVYCAVFEAVAVSLNSSDEWAANRLLVEFSEMLDDASLADRAQEIDNLSQAVHGVQFVERAEARLAVETTSREFWARRARLYPNLLFGLDVEDQLQRLDEATFRLVLSRLSELEATAKKWMDSQSVQPEYCSHVSPESDSTMQHPRLRAARIFRDAQGVPQVFEWHARFGSGGRIHFVPNASERTIEVGYIGPHLPL